jgi:site-specific recombinase XerD
MSEILEEFKTHLKNEGLSKSTIRRYLNDLKLFQNWFETTTGDEFIPQNITTYDIAGYKEHLLSKRRKPATINRYLVSLTRFCEWAVERGLVATNPARSVKGIKEVKTAPKALTKNEVRRFLREVHKSRKLRDIAIFELMANTGLRVGELVDLRVEDLELGPRSGTLVVRKGKGEKYRVVPLNLKVRKIIAEYLSEYPQRTYLFNSQKGGPLTTYAVWNLVKKYAHLAGLEMSPHTLRHTFATLLLRSGEDIVKVATLLGHERLDTTARYTRPSLEDMTQAVERLGL